jgi:hypothetical protein
LLYWTLLYWTLLYWIGINHLIAPSMPMEGKAKRDHSHDRTGPIPAKDPSGIRVQNQPNLIWGID